MPLLILGVLVVHAAAFAWGVGDGFAWLRYQKGDIGTLALVMVLIPACSAWAGGEFIQMMSPRRALDGRLRCRGLRFLLGMCAGLIGLGTGAAILPLVDRFASDALTMGATSSLSAMLLLLLLKRLRPGHCISCGYDQRGMPGPGQPGSGICPECGSRAYPHGEALRS